MKKHLLALATTLDCRDFEELFTFARFFLEMSHPPFKAASAVSSNGILFLRNISNSWPDTGETDSNTKSRQRMRSDRAPEKTCLDRVTH